MPSDLLLKSMLLAALLWPFHPCPALELVGRTRSGMDFRGTVAEVSEDVLLLRESLTENRPQLGIPLDQLQQLGLRPPILEGLELIIQLEGYNALLPFLDADSHSRIFKVLSETAPALGWKSVFLWSGRLETCVTSQSLRQQTVLLKARALLEMNSLHRLEAELANLNAGITPLDAPPLLCLLNARFHLLRDQPEEALFWASLPEVQIPAPGGPLTATLADLRASLETGENRTTVSMDRYRKGIP